ncbi:DinB family protein [Spirosoma koreense]
MDRYSSLVAFNSWANQRMLTQAAMLSAAEFNKELGGSFPSIRLTTTHLLISDWLWLNRWQGNPIVPIPSDWDTTTADSIEALWIPIQYAMEQRIQTLLAGGDEQVIIFTTLKGSTFELPLWQTINHVVNHGTYHRGQLANMVRMQGHTPVNTDMFLFFAEA